VGSLVGLANIPYTFEPSLVDRSPLDQGLVTGWSFLVHETTARLAHSAATSALAVARRPNDVRGPAPAAVDAAAVAAGLVVQLVAARRSPEPNARAAARTTGYVLASAGAAGLAVDVIDALVSHPRWRIGRWQPDPTLLAALALTAASELRRRHGDADATTTPPSVPRALAMGSAVTIGTWLAGTVEGRLARQVARAAAHVLPGDERRWQPVGHLAASAILAAGLRQGIGAAFAMIERQQTSVEPAFDLPPLSALVSGSRASQVPFDTLARHGRRFAWTVTHPTTIDEVLGETGSLHPIRAYVGLDSAPTAQQRVDLLLDELDRTSAWDRSWLMVASPTGTGQMNAAASAAFEVLTRGDCAIAGMQYAARPSFLSLDRVAEGRAQCRLLLDAIAKRTDALGGRRPKIVLFGESLGAWTSQDAVMGRGTSGLERLGIDAAVWIGTPSFSRWKDEVLGPDRPDTDRGLVAACDSMDDWHRLVDERGATPRYVMVTHHDDGVALFGGQLLVRAPDWLASGVPRPNRVPASMRWVPFTTFFQVFADMKNAVQITPGRLEAKAHDYRADVGPFLRATLQVDVSEDQLARLQKWLEDDERSRSDWIDQHPDAGSSMAAHVVRSWMDEHPDDLEAVLGARLRAAAQPQTPPPG
jgi:uncharacterized membrane protein